MSDPEDTDPDDDVEEIVPGAGDPGETELDSDDSEETESDSDDSEDTPTHAPLAELSEQIRSNRSGSDGTGADDSDVPEMDALSSDEPAEFESSPEDDAPLGEIAGDVRKRRQQRDADDDEDPFEEMDIGGELDGEEIWENLVSDESMSETERAVGAGVSVTEVGAEDRDEYVIPKDQFCGRCPYLSDPPMLTCEHDGTEIIEVTNSENFRVRNCPFADRDEEELAELE